MIQIYYGAADRDKDRFLFDCIKETLPADTILLVPDQFTLQAERNAFEYLNSDTLLELEIMSRSSFSSRITASQGGPSGISVDKYGRHMLLTNLMLSEEKQEGIFAAVNRRRSFISMLNDQISEMKQYNITPLELGEASGRFEDEEVLYSKLADISEIYEKYEKSVAGKFTDTEDFQRIVTEKIYESKRVSQSEFYVDGFDYMTPNMLSQLTAIACTAKNLNIILTGDDSVDEVFAISRRMRENLREIAERNGIVYRETEISKAYILPLKPEVSVMRAGDFYSEAESIAIDIVKLIREKDYRYRDIVIICNDAEKRGSVFRRVFESYGIPLFIDRKRSISEEPAVEFIFAMLDVVETGRRFNDVFRMIKTGYSPLSDTAMEELEIYCRKYNIRSGRWKKDFVYGVRDEGQEKLDRLNEYRKSVDDFITEAEHLFKGKETVKQRTEALYRFLAETVRLPELLDEAKLRLESEDNLEAAEGTAQIWQIIISIFDQQVEVLGEEKIPHEDYVEILREGFSEVEIGLIPTNNDQVILGTMQRTRIGNTKAMFVAGANEGVLPENSRSESLFSDEEKQLIMEKWRRICKTGELKDMEQSLAMYKNLNKATEILSVSYAEMDTEGAELRPSELVSDIFRRFPEAELRMDYISAGDDMQLVQTKKSVLPHLTRNLRQLIDGGAIGDVWRAAALVSDGDDSYETVKKGLFYSNDVEAIGKETVRNLYGKGTSKSLVLSASGMEKYTRCPFSFFVAYGLRPEEERSFEVDMRSIGDVYHECMRRLAEHLTEPDTEISSPESKWHKITQASCRQLTDHYVDDFADRYREGVFNLSGREKYVQRRIKEICFQSAWLMISQVKSGKVKSIYFEERFGRRSDALFPPIELKNDEDTSVFLEGIIDRVDVINGYSDAGEEQDYVRIIDYKSGNEAFDIGEVKDGWRLQLMIYLKGAMGAIMDSRPAGVFYFAIKDKTVDVTDVGEAEVDGVVADELGKSARLDGILVDRNEIIEGMDENIEYQSASEVIPVRRKKDGTYTGSSLLSEDEFDELIDTNDSNLMASAARFAMGCVDIDPKKGKKADACRFCNFRSICSKE